jgi:hypothetical protein
MAGWQMVEEDQSWFYKESLFQFCPSLGRAASSVGVREQVLVEALVPQPAVEALDEAILHRFCPARM